jgi:dienelactone hydrolase
MHILDLILIIVILALYILYILKQKIDPIYFKTTIYISFFVILAHGLFELARWQFVLLYIAWLVMVVMHDFNVTKKSVCKTLIAVLSVSLVISISTVIIFPVNDIPTPSGEYKIGTRSFIVDEQRRLELYTESLVDTRKFMFQIWYPTDEVNDLILDQWMYNQDVPKGLALSMGFPKFLLNHTASIMSNSYINAPISLSLEKYPVVIISHGWGGFMNLHTDLAEELASRGYIVVSIDHTYGSVATPFGEGPVYQYKEALPSRDEVDNFLDYAHQLVYTYAGDVSETIDYLERINEVAYWSFLRGKLDLEHIGLIGHSTGGGGDVAVALNDQRIDAVIGLDAWVESIKESEIEKGLSMPALFLRSETWEEGENNKNLFTLVENSNDAKLYQIDGTTHADFSMAYMFSPLMRTIGYTGSLNTYYLVNMQKDIINNFFDLHLKNDENNVIDYSEWDELHEVLSS